MKSNPKTFQQILEEKLQKSKNTENIFTTNRIKLEHSFPLFFENLSIKIKKTPTYPKPKEFSPEEKLQFWLDKCPSAEEKNAVKFFFNMGEIGFLFDKSPRAIDKSFRKLAHKLHPDRFQNESSELIDQKKCEFIELRSHYIVLKKLAKHL